MVWAKGHKLQNGKYVIEEVLGQGGFGITYKALNTLINQCIVIKTPNEYLKHDPDYDEYVRKFIREAKMLKKFSENPHPHIVCFRNFFQEQDTYYLVMDFIDGENLFQVVRKRRRIPEKEAVRYIQQIGSALESFHKVGAVHRDAHPGNIMIDRDGKAILIDFGIAKELKPSTQTSTGNAGNQGFASYEQLYQGSREPNVDVYSLAATLYFIVTGKCPINCVNRKLDHTRLIPPKEIIASLSKEVNEAILKGMALEAKDRPQTMQEWFQYPKAINKPSKKRLFNQIKLDSLIKLFSNFRKSKVNKKRQKIKVINPIFFSTARAFLITSMIFSVTIVILIQGYYLYNRPKPFVEAVQIATKASESGHSVETVDEWVELAAQWRKASDLMASVSPDYFRYQTAQDRIQVYTENSEVALQQSRYLRLRELLKSGLWQKADQLTWEILIRAVGKDVRDHLTRDDITNFPCQDFEIVDELWTEYSDGHFGFSVQNQVWQQAGGLDAKFAELVSWRHPLNIDSESVFSNEWLYYNELIFDLSAPKGHLPADVTMCGGRGLNRPGCGGKATWTWREKFLQRVAACKS